uniref:Uncharacterized protein n=1 Tax=Rhizophora mucronata TaxID=61149 RepID=A0A2P2QWY2_RHIMU
MYLLSGAFIIFEHVPQTMLQKT